MKAPWDEGLPIGGMTKKNTGINCETRTASLPWPLGIRPTPCPFCGASSVFIEATQTRDDDEADIDEAWPDYVNYSAYCLPCGATGPQDDSMTPISAAKVWNDRATKNVNHLN